ncbi:MAG: hypothetical protein IJJ60_00870, partial [Clostridia bacterium]|nr:hypothetical protein [Clostridia bacterium]
GNALFPHFAQGRSSFGRRPFFMAESEFTGWGPFPLDKRSRFLYNESESRENTRGETGTEKETLCP